MKLSQKQKILFYLISLGIIMAIDFIIRNSLFDFSIEYIKNSHREDKLSGPFY